MLSEKQKREAQLSILEKLRKQGAPAKDKEADMKGMFDLGVDEGGRIAYADEDKVTPRPEEEEEIPYAPGRQPPKQAVTPQWVTGNFAKPKRPSKKSSL